MPSKLKLSINEPCHQNWHSMNPTEQGRYCNACAKEVVDFTAMSDTEVLYYFLERKKENVCGRMTEQQLSGEFVKPVYTKRKMLWYWNYVVMFFLLLFKGNITKAQKITKLPLAEQLSKTIALAEIVGKVGAVSIAATVSEDKKFQISGTVTGKEGTPIAGAHVKIKGTDINTVAGMDGTYFLNGVTEKNVVIVSAVGYTHTEKKIYHAGENDFVLQATVMGGFEVVTVGFISSDYNYTPPAPLKHAAVIEVRDNATSVPLKATLTIQKKGDIQTTTSITSKEGVYKLKRIKEDDSYMVTVSAVGYRDSVLKIDGWKFNDRKESRYVFLEKEKQPPIVNKEEASVFRMGAVSINYEEPLYVVDGVIVEKLNGLHPEEIYSIDVLKGTAASAIYGVRGLAGVIIITTKKIKKDIAPSLQSKPVCIDKAPATYAGDNTAFDDFKISPNPVQKSNLVTLSFTAKLQGDYILQVSNAAGVVMYSQKASVQLKNNLLHLQTKSNWASGIYYVSMIDAANNRVGAGSFILD